MQGMRGDSETMTMTLQETAQVVCMVIMAALIVFSIQSSIDDNSVPKFSVDIAAVEHLNSTVIDVGHTVSLGAPSQRG